MATLALSQKSFNVDRNFYDDRNYPRGMKRSGDFTLAEAELLEKFGVALMALSSGTRLPVTEEEQHFVDVCRGNTTVGNTIERAWLKYQNIILTPKQFHTLFGRTKIEADEEIESDPDDLD
ncbi:DUF413 domain-containing protein [Colwellia sp. PAMC 21821]|uniref:DUF413 domain-containing protein n=1 Tax=Colwellia sp. PAMC 21821 TaxID=1816219 RepID=UPI0009BE5B30|nr:DUF413 domain-containing protein [Colwellia sp. PAMC 21821]ARD44711.1 hypothetical protein A3Q33_10560 [Colwellia sp. PAMC 21821]